MPTNRTYRLLIISTLIILIASPCIWGAGKVKYYVINSDSLAKNGEKAQRELGVYLPEEYDISESYYPVLYLIHGFTGTNRTFLGAGYGGFMSDANVSLIVDKLIQEGKITPLIVACPDMNRAWYRKAEGIFPYDEYFIQEIVSYMDENFRTIPVRQKRAISGHSLGGHDSLNIALLHPEIFSLAGGYSSGYTNGFLPSDLLRIHNQKSFPLQFWLYAGRNDNYGLSPLSKDFANTLEELAFPYVYIEDDGDHFNKIAMRLGESIEYFSNFFNVSVTQVKPIGKTASLWGNIKQLKNPIQ